MMLNRAFFSFFALVALASVSALVGCSSADTDAGPSTEQDVVAGSPRIVCSMKRLAAIPGGEAHVDVDVTRVTEDKPGISGGLDAFDGSYAFDVTKDATSLSVIFTESKHIEDETGSKGCDLPKPLKRGVVFCQDTLEVDKHLGDDSGDRQMVHAFDFACRVE